MVATGLISMWISNTATTLMMITIATALIAEIQAISDTSSTDFFKAILLGVAYSASIGGVATLVGTPTNPIFVAVAKELYDIEFSFVSWLSFALPFALLMIFLTWFILTRFIYKLHLIDLPFSKKIIRKELDKLGLMSVEEKRVGMVFLATALLWITRTFLLNKFIQGINDTVIAVAAAISLFIIQSKKRKPLLTWSEAERLPWGIIILFGGGLSLAAAFSSSGLAAWLGNQLVIVKELPLFLIILIVALSVNFLTEITSNVATASISLPILAALADGIGVHPFLLMVPATMAASCAFMLPVATAPNAIVFGSGHLQIRDMARSGFSLNLISSILISLFVYLVLPAFL
jgi:sodium-dependent dicarboxylate transporter 2/3/5